MRSSRALRDDRGMVTAELAACLPVLLLVLAVAVTAVSAVAARVRVLDAAREAARVAARGDRAAALQVAHEVAPGAQLALSRAGPDVVAVVRARTHPFGGWLPGLTVVGRAVAAIEPRAGAP
jgi:Flp pilus assembly protein TadG